MISRFIGFLLILTILYTGFKVYGYRYVLDHVRSESSVDMVIGRPNAPINILAYIDYKSDSSKQLNAKLISVLSADPDVNILVRPVAGVDEISDLLARFAFAAQERGVFMEFHNLLMRTNMELNENQLARLIHVMGVNYNQLKEDAFGLKVEEQIKSVNTELVLLGINHLPSYYVEHVAMEGVGESLENVMRTIDKLKAKRL